MTLLFEKVAEDDQKIRYLACSCTSTFTNCEAIDGEQSDHRSKVELIFDKSTLTWSISIDAVLSGGFGETYRGGVPYGRLVLGSKLNYTK